MQKTAIVTGASRGFGRGIASVLSMEGEYKVFATARNKAALDSLKKEVDEFGGAGEVIPYVLDQNNDKEVEKFDGMSGLGMKLSLASSTLMILLYFIVPSFLLNLTDIASKVFS